MPIPADVIRFRPLLELIALHEGTHDQPNDGYDTTLGFGLFVEGAPVLTDMTLDEMDLLQTGMLRHPANALNSSACGRYQIVRLTLRDLRRQFGLAGNALFTPELQDRLAAALIRRRGRDVRKLRLEWAGLVKAGAEEILDAYDRPGTAQAGEVAQTSGSAPLVSPHPRPRPDGLGPDAPGPALPAGTPVYEVVKLTDGDAAELTEMLNARAAEGWRLNQIVPKSTRTLFVVLEREAQSAEDEDEPADAVTPDLVDDVVRQQRAGETPVPAAGGDQRARFFDHIDAQGLRFFEPGEFLTMGASHFSGGCAGRNAFPPEELWENIVPTARVLDMLRERLGASIRLTSVYRAPAYNRCIGGASRSLHMEFNACDFTCDDGRDPAHWARVLKSMRDDGIFDGGIGLYRSFVHVDTRGTNPVFGPRKHLLG